MSQNESYHSLSRRNLVAGLTVLPLAGIAQGAFAEGFWGLNRPRSILSKNGARLSRVRFLEMGAPGFVDASAMATTTVNSKLVAEFADGTEQSFDLSYKPFFLTGTKVPDGKGGSVVAGAYYDIKGRPIIDNSGRSPRQFFSDSPDGSSLIQLRSPCVPGVQGNTVFAVVQFEYTTRDLAGNSQYGQLPSPIAVLSLDQNPGTGELRLVKYHNVDTSSVHGLWITCGASLSPWGTHLSSEEYQPDATTIETNAQFQAFSQNLYGDKAKANPYHYGHQPEVIVRRDGTATIKKHYCLGRISHELIQVLPDERTVLMGDDATNGGIFMFIADRARDLSSGTLYVAKWQQLSGEKGGSARLMWIRLGHATSDEVKAMADTYKASDIMDVKWEDPLDETYTKIPYSGKTNWVKVVKGREKAACFLETHRYAALKGGSLSFTKYEGTTVNAKDKIAYIAMASITGPMKDGTTDVQVKGPKSGAVYALNLEGGQVDSKGQSIQSLWVPSHMQAIPELIGEDLASPDDLGNLANPNRIANPDNIKFSARLRTLFIGEDSGMHVNNFLWAYNVDTKELTRILSCPSGAESTGLHAADDVNGFTYIMSNFQHPGDWELTKDENGVVIGGLHAKVHEELEPLIRANYNDRYGAAVGYLTGMPVLSR